MPTYDPAAIRRAFGTPLSDADCRALAETAHRIARHRATEHKPDGMVLAPLWAPPGTTRIADEPINIGCRIESHWPDWVLADDGRWVLDPAHPLTATLAPSVS